VRIEQLRINVVRSISRVVPDSIEASIGRNSKCAEPVPLILGWVVIDPVWRAEGQSAVCAAHKHHVSPIALAWRLNARQHVNVVVRGSAGSVDRQE
jgi:hypothetical protein